MERAYKKIEVTPDALLGCRFFDRLERAERAHIARYCEGRIYRRGYEIVRHRDNTRDVFFIVSGRAEATVLTMSGKVVSFQTLHNGEMFGEISALDAAPRSTSVVTEEETTVIRISGPNFKDLVARNACLAEQTMLRLCALSRHLCEKAFEPRAYPVPAQIQLEIYRELEMRGSEQGLVSICPAPTHKEIAERVGTTREQVTRVMSALGKTGMLTQRGRSWIVDDIERVLIYLRESLRPMSC